MEPEAILDHHDRGTPWPAAPIDDDVDVAYRTAASVRALRIARGERPVGYKIGFTNRTLWARYRVFAPIWGPVWDTTLTHAGHDDAGTIDLAATCQPRIEPEIAFGIASTPASGATLETLFDAVDWIAPGFEIVQSHRPDWKFTAADTIADGALHARLLVGQRTPVRRFAPDGAGLDDLLARTTLRLRRGDVPVDEGTGANVLDGPLHALLHFVHELERRPDTPRLMPGDVVTTGTWTDAWPVRAGETWSSTFDAPFDGLRIAFA